MYMVDVSVEGSVAILMHKFNVEDQIQADPDKPGNIKKAGRRAKSAKEEAEEAAYRTSDGELYIPSESFYQSMCKAATDFQVKGKGKKTYKGVVQGNVLVSPDCIPLGTDTYEIDSRPVNINRSRIPRHRPLLYPWEASFQLTVLDGDLLPDDVLNAVLVKAGQSIGILDYRPRYGRFVVTRFALVK